MKDNFDLKNYLVENKMTENSRGEGRHHFGKAFINPRVLTEDFDPYDHHDPDYDEDWASEEGADALDRYNDALRDDALAECGDVPTDFDSTIQEAGYTDDEDDWDDTDASLANILRTDKKAKQAQKAAARDIEPVDDSDLDAPVGDEPVDEPDEAPAAPKGQNKWVTGDLSMDSLFGADAPNVDILVGDEDLTNDEALKQLFQQNKNYRPALLKRAVSQAMDYFREYEKPDVLYLMPAIDRGGYEMSRFNAGRRAVAAVYRPENLSGQEWADQI